MPQGEAETNSARLILGTLNGRAINVNAALQSSLLAHRPPSSFGPDTILRSSKGQPECQSFAISQYLGLFRNHAAAEFSDGGVMDADCDDDLSTSPKRPNDPETRQIPTSPPVSKITTDHNMTASANAAATPLCTKCFNTVVVHGSCCSRAQAN